MADYTTLKTAVQIAIKANNNNEITGKILQQQLLAMINSLGSGYQLAGILMPSDTPKTDDQRVAYLAVEPGMYENAGGFEVTELSLLMYDTAWEVHPLGVPFGSQIAAVIKALQDADKANAKAIADEKTSRTTAILAEQQTREQTDTTLQENIDKKQDTISDLTTIRTQAAHGQTAFSWGDHSKVGYITGITKAMVEDVLTGNITSHTHTFASLTDKPTTISGYGIRDAYTKAETDRKVVELQGLLDSMFERVYDSNNKLIRVHSNVTISSSGDLVAGGNSGGGGTSGGGKTYLNELLDVQLATSSLNVGDMLMWNGEKYVNIPQSSITPDLSDYATQQWVLDKKYLTSVPVTSVVGQTGNITTAQVATALTDAGYKLTDTTYELATTTSNGLMSATDKTKLNGIAENANNYTLPTASSSTKGGIKVGTTLGISGGVLDLKSGFPSGTYTKVQTDSYGRVVSGSTLSASDIPNLSWNKITTDKPTTISGYGITDAYTKTETDNKVAALQSLLDSMFERVYDSNNKLIRVHSNVTISSSGDLVAGSNSEGGGTSGGAYTQLEWNAIKALTQSESGLLASAYSVKEAYNELNTAIPTKVSQLTNDSGYITGITKAMVEGVLTGNITSHTHSYIPLSDKGLSNGKVPYYVDFPDFQNLVTLGYNEESTATNDEYYFKGLCKWAIDNFAGQGQIILIGNARPNSIGFCYIQLYSNDGKDATTGLPRYCSGTYISLDRATTNFGCINYVWNWGGSFNGIASSSSKWATPRTITLTGSVTGSVSIDGSANVSLATTTNHTHNYAGSSSAGGSANSALTLLYNNKFDTTYGDYAIFQQNYSISDFPHSGWFNSIKMLHNNSHGYFTEIAMSFAGEDGMWRRALQAGTQIGWYKMLDSGNFNSYAPKLDGTGASGTWGISISGNAATATTARYIETLNIDGNIWYGDNYKMYAQWVSPTVLELKVDGYKTMAWQAEELHTPRTIWGQSFDGTGNVSGALSEVTNINSALYINSSGNVTIGGSDLAGTDAKLYVGGKLRLPYLHLYGNNIYSDTDGLYIQPYGAGNVFINQIRTNTIINPIGGNVGIGTESPAYKLHIVGTAYASENLIAAGDLTAGSDIRYKDKIQDLRLSVHDIALAPAFTYKWNNREDALVHIGSSAQYWLNTDAKDAVYYDKQNDFYHLNYASLALCNTIILARGMETQEEKIARLEARINELEDKLRQYDSCR